MTSVDGLAQMIISLPKLTSVRVKRGGFGKEDGAEVGMRNAADIFLTEVWFENPTQR